MAERKIIAVLGATGAQGGGLVRAILADPRAASPPRAHQERELGQGQGAGPVGAEVVAADVDSEESLKKAFAGAYGASASPSSGTLLAEKEIAQAGAMARAPRPRA